MMTAIPVWPSWPASSGPSLLPERGWPGTGDLVPPRTASVSTLRTRRSVDTPTHLVDHLAEIEALLDERPSRPDGWHGSLVTVAADWAPFTEVDLNEAQQCLLRLADLYVHRLAAAGTDEWDKSRDPHWTMRGITEHVGRPWYAEQVSDLSVRR